MAHYASWYNFCFNCCFIAKFFSQVMEESWKPWTINRDAYIYRKGDEKWLRKSALNNDWFRFSKEIYIYLL